MFLRPLRPLTLITLDIQQSQPSTHESHVLEINIPRCLKQRPNSHFPAQSPRPAKRHNNLAKLITIMTYNTGEASGPKNGKRKRLPAMPKTATAASLLVRMYIMNRTTTQMSRIHQGPPQASVYKRSIDSITEPLLNCSKAGV